MYYLHNWPMAPCGSLWCLHMCSPGASDCSTFTHLATLWPEITCNIEDHKKWKNRHKQNNAQPRCMQCQQDWHINRSERRNPCSRLHSRLINIHTYVAQWKSTEGTTGAVVQWVGHFLCRFPTQVQSPVHYQGILGFSGVIAECIAKSQPYAQPDMTQNKTEKKSKNLLQAELANIWEHTQPLIMVPQMRDNSNAY